MRHGGVALLLCATGALGGCAGTSGVSDALTAGALDKRKAGVVILKADILGHGCRGGSLTLGKKLGDLYSAVATVQTTASAASNGDDVMQVELPPDEYHVINVACGVQSGISVTNVALGRKEGGTILGIGGDYRRSFATFELKAGEIVNIGALTVMAGVASGAHISVADLPAASLQRFRKAKPNLATQMKTRLMTVLRAPMPAADRQTLCANIREIRAATKTTGPLPPECAPTPQRLPPARAAETTETTVTPP